LPCAQRLLPLTQTLTLTLYPCAQRLLPLTQTLTLTLYPCAQRLLALTQADLFQLLPTKLDADILTDALGELRSGEPVRCHL